MDAAGSPRILLIISAFLLDLHLSSTTATPPPHIHSLSTATTTIESLRTPEVKVAATLVYLMRT